MTIGRGAPYRQNAGKRGADGQEGKQRNAHSKSIFTGRLFVPRRSRHNLNQWHNALYVSFVATSGVATTGVGSTSAIDRTVQCDGSVGPDWRRQHIGD